MKLDRKFTIRTKMRKKRKYNVRRRFVKYIFKKTIVTRNDDVRNCNHFWKKHVKFVILLTLKSNEILFDSFESKKINLRKITQFSNKFKQLIIIKFFVTIRIELISSWSIMNKFASTEIFNFILWTCENMTWFLIIHDWTKLIEIFVDVIVVEHIERKIRRKLKK